MSLLLTMNIFHTHLFYVSIINFGHVIANWVSSLYRDGWLDDLKWYNLPRQNF